MGTDIEGMGGNGYMGRGDSEGTGREFSLRGGDGEEMLSPCRYIHRHGRPQGGTGEGTCFPRLLD